MDPVKYFFEFYNGLNTPGLVLFWMIIVFFFFLIFSLIALLFKNQELRKVIKILKEELSKNETKNETLEKEEAKEEPKEKIVNQPSLNERGFLMKKEDVENLLEQNQIENEIDKIENDTFDLEEAQDEDYQENAYEQEERLYKRNVLNQMTRPISPVGITNYEEKPKVDKQKLNPIEIEDLNEIYYEETNNNFVEEIEKQVEEELDSSPIDLTEFETTQEEDAIISYEELLRNAKMAETREKRYNIDFEDDDNFLKELKSFRNNL